MSFRETKNVVFFLLPRIKFFILLSLMNFDIWGPIIVLSVHDHVYFLITCHIFHQFSFNPTESLSKIC